MPSASDIRRLIAVIDHQIVELLGKRMQLLLQQVAQMEDENETLENATQVLSNWLEDAIDHHLPEESVERICKAVMDMGKKAQD